MKSHQCPYCSLGNPLTWLTSVATFRNVNVSNLLRGNHAETMHKDRRKLDPITVAVFSVAITLGLPGAAGAQADSTTWQWENQAELSVVFAGGNAEASTFGAKNVLTGTGPNSSFKLEAGGLRTESSIKTRTATGPTADNYTLVETSRSDVTAESYYVRGRFDRNFSDHTLAFAGAGWERNTFAGISSRYSLVGGAGSRWVSRPDFKFKTDLGVTYTVQDNVAGNGNDRFMGLRASWDLTKTLTETTKIASVLVVDENLKETEDLRADFTNSITVAISQLLALKSSLQILFDNQPSFVEVPLEFPAGTPTGETVLAELDQVDSVFTVALVFNF